MSDNSDDKSLWLRQLDKGLDADTWGQGIEAIDEYETLIKLIESKMNKAELTTDERSLIGKIKLSVQIRVNTINESNKKAPLPLSELKKTKQVLQDMIRSQITDTKFPIQLENYAESLTDASGWEQKSIATSGSTLLPPLKITKSGTTTVSIYVEKIGLKDATSYIDGRITVALCDDQGRAIGSFQTTPPSTKTEGFYVYFDTEVHIQNTLDDLRPTWAFFFEFKHWKPKKKKLSVRCWSLLEHDELNPGPRQLELYKKPTDYTRKNIRLHSVKPYALLHVNIKFHKH